MALFTHASGNFTVSQGAVQQIYMCPATGKSHAYVEAVFFKPTNPGTSLIGVAKSTDSNPANLTSLDYFLDDIELIDSANSATLEKIIVGPGERLYVTVFSGEPVNVRFYAVEENNSRVLDAGRLAGQVAANTNMFQLYQSSVPADYITGAITVFNTSTTANANIKIWVSTSTTPSAADQIAEFEITPEDSAIVENLTIRDNERIFVQTDQAGSEFVYQGLVVGTPGV